MGISAPKKLLLMSGLCAWLDFTTSSQAQSPLKLPMLKLTTKNQIETRLPESECNDKNIRSLITSFC